MFVSLHVCVSVCMLRSYIPYLNVQDRASQIAAIENSFEQAKQPVSCCTCEVGHLLAQGRKEGGRKGGGRKEGGREGGGRREGEVGCVRDVSLLSPRSLGTTASLEWLQKKYCRCSLTFRYVHMHTG